MENSRCTTVGCPCRGRSNIPKRARLTLSFWTILDPEKLPEAWTGSIDLFDLFRALPILAAAHVVQPPLTGLGITVLPEWLIEGDLVSGRLVRVLPKWRARELPVYVVYLAQRRLPLRVRTFFDFAVDYMSTVLKPIRVNEPPLANERENTAQACGFCWTSAKSRFIWTSFGVKTSGHVRRKRGRRPASLATLSSSTKTDSGGETPWP